MQDVKVLVLGGITVLVCSSLCSKAHSAPTNFDGQAAETDNADIYSPIDSSRTGNCALTGQPLPRKSL